MNTSTLIDSPNAPNEATPGVPNPGAAIALLYEKAAVNLTDAELGWFSGSMRGHAVVELDNLSQTMEAAACIINSSDLSLSMSDETTLAKFLFSLSNQLDTITGFMKIGDEAAYRLKVKADPAKSQA